MSFKVKHGGVWKDAAPSVKHGGTWKTPVEIFVKQAGVWVSTWVGVTFTEWTTTLGPLTKGVSIGLTQYTTAAASEAVIGGFSTYSGTIDNNNRMTLYLDDDDGAVTSDANTTFSIFVGNSDGQVTDTNFATNFSLNDPAGTTFRLYDTDDTTVLWTWTGDQMAYSSNQLQLSTTRLGLSQNTTYRIEVEY